MRWVLFLVMTISFVSMTLIPTFAQSPSHFDVKDPTGQQSYGVNYIITGATVDDMTIDTGDTSLVVSLNTTNDGILTITLPRTLIDAQLDGEDDIFFVLVDGADTDFQESKTSTDRTLTIPFTDGTQEIEILGTQVVPEFGSLVTIVLVFAIMSVIVFSAKNKLKM